VVLGQIGLGGASISTVAQWKLKRRSKLVKVRDRIGSRIFAIEKTDFNMCPMAAICQPNPTFLETCQFHFFPPILFSHRRLLRLGENIFRLRFGGRAASKFFHFSLSRVQSVTPHVSLWAKFQIFVMLNLWVDLETFSLSSPC